MIRFKFFVFPLFMPKQKSELLFITLLARGTRRHSLLLFFKKRVKRANCSSRSFKKSNESDLLTSLFIKTYRLQYFAVLRLFLLKNVCNLCPFSWQTSCFKFYKFFTIFIMSAGAVMPILHFIYFFSSICDEKLQNVTWKKC